jgi:hypothetical protein
MSRSLFDLFTQLSISEQKDVREHVHCTLDPVTYIKEKFTLLPRVEQEAFAHLIEQGKVSSCKDIYSLQSSDEEEFDEEISSDEEVTVHDTRLDDALLDYPVHNHCMRCTCRDNDDCACTRGCDHYCGTVEDLDRELDEMQRDNYRWRMQRRYPATITLLKRLTARTDVKSRPRVVSLSALMASRACALDTNK